MDGWVDKRMGGWMDGLQYPSADEWKEMGDTGSYTLLFVLS
jgi:hypothetical protein